MKQNTQICDNLQFIRERFIKRKVDPLDYNVSHYTLDRIESLLRNATNTAPSKFNIIKQQFHIQTIEDSDTQPLPCIENLSATSKCKYKEKKQTKQKQTTKHQTL